MKVKNRTRISNKEFADPSNLLTEKRISEYINPNVSKYFEWKCSSYLNDVFEAASEGDLTLRNSNHKLMQSFHKATTGQKYLTEKVTKNRQT